MRHIFFIPLLINQKLIADQHVRFSQLFKGTLITIIKGPYNNVLLFFLLIIQIRT